jgi:hypothetical protein
MSSGASWYNAMQANLKKAMSHGLQFQATYTWSKALDNSQGQKFTDKVSRPGSGASALQAQNPFDRRAEWAASDFDIQHNFRFSATFRLPGPRQEGFLSKALGGWWLGSIASWQTGSPFHPGGGPQTLSGGSARPNYVTAANVDYARANGQPDAEIFDPNRVIIGKPDHWFNANMFTIAPQDPATCSYGVVLANGKCSSFGTLGNVGRNILRGPGLSMLNLSLSKDIALGFLGESGKLQFRTEVFNVLNHVNFGYPRNTALNSPRANTAGRSTIANVPPTTHGQITATATENRQFQLSLRLAF